MLKTFSQRDLTIDKLKIIPRISVESVKNQNISQYMAKTNGKILNFMDQESANFLARPNRVNRVDLSLRSVDLWCL